MAFIKCSACSREVSDKAATCPGCGAPLTPIPDSVRFTRKGRKWDGIGFALVLLGIVIGMVSNVALGWAVAFAGLAVFIVGRSK
jgi:predicted amidophosphoribosyltransferase